MAILRVYNPLTESWDPIPYIKGDKGDRGYDVTTVEYEYYSSTSSSEPTGGEWSTIMPGYSEGRYIWVRTKTTNSHGEVYTGTPVLATLFNDVNSAELSRRTYETNRVNAETARDTAEGLRDSAETARASAELLRVSAETSRGNSEVSRANAEAQRVSAESSRVSVEAQRVANEEQRISNENARIAAQGRYPIVQNNTWWVWSKEDDDYVDTEVTAVGANGVGIASIELTSTVDLVDTYTITFDDGSTTTFDVTNGQDGISPTITVTPITGGHEVEVVDAEGTQTFNVMDGEVSEQDLEDALIDKADVITSTASGEIVTIADGGKDLPVVDLKLSLLPVQSGSGDPSPDNVRPISGWTGVRYFHTDYNLLKIDRFTTAPNDYQPIYDPVANDLTVSTNPARQYARVAQTIPVEKNTAYTISANYVFPWEHQNAKGLIYVGTTGGTQIAATEAFNMNGLKSLAFNSGNNTQVEVRFYVSRDSYYGYPAHISNVICCPTSVYSAVQNESAYINWSSSAGTVYGCNIDPVSGVLTVDSVLLQYPDITWEQINANNGFKAWRSYVSSTFATKSGASALSNMVAEFGSFSSASMTKNIIQLPAFLVNKWVMHMALQEDADPNDVQVWYQIANAQTFQLTENQIATYLGINNFWSNGNGSIDLEYRCDTRLYIEQLTKPTEDDMVANANIASGKFFMVGNRLMLSTTAIAQGEQIVVGTNCSEVSLADALNQINA